MKNAALLACYLLFVTASNIFLKLAAGAGEAWAAAGIFAAGNVVGFVAVLAYTGLLRGLPLHVAFPLSRGLGVIGVQVVGALAFFHETFTLREAGAVALVTAGIVLVGVSAPRARKPGTGAPASAQGSPP